MQFQDLWTTVDQDVEPRVLPANLTISEIKMHNEESVEPYKALATIHASVSDGVLARMLTCTTGKEALDK